MQNTNQMTVEQVVNFLKIKPGYRKEGAKRLSQKVLSGLASINTCRLAIKEFNSLSTSESTTDDKKLKVLIYDIETSYNIVSTWRVGYNINLSADSIIDERKIICVSYKWLGEDEVHTIAWDHNRDDKTLLENFIKVMNQSDIMVAHNGDKFDIKWIRARAIKHGLSMLPFYVQVDTLKIAKKNFYFNSNRLDYLCKFLGFEGKKSTTPGLWDKVIRGSNKESLEGLNEMIDYCEEDVRQLEKLYIKFRDWDKPKQHAGSLLYGNTASSPVDGSTDLTLVKTVTTNAGTRKRIMKDNKTNKTFEMSDANYKKFLKQMEEQNE